VLNQVKQLVLIVRTALGINGVQLGKHAGPCQISAVQIILGKAAANSVNQVIKVNAASHHAVHFLVNLHSTQLGIHGNVLAGFQTLTANALGAFSNVGNSQQARLGGMENVGIAQRGIAVLNKIGKELVTLQALFTNLINQNFGNSKQVAALTVADILVVHAGLAIISLNHGLAQNFLAVFHAVFAQVAMVAINGQLNQFLIHVNTPLHIKIGAAIGHTSN